MREPWGTWQGAAADDDSALLMMEAVGSPVGLGLGMGMAAAALGGGGGGSGGAAGQRPGAGAVWRGREEVQLPREGGWQWAGEWRLDMRGQQQQQQAGPLVDAEGWEYRTVSGERGRDYAEWRSAVRLSVHSLLVSTQPTVTT